MKEITLRGKWGIGSVALIDDDDFDKVSKKKWYVTINGYPKNGKEKLYLHKFIIKCPKGKFVDHINHNLLDNRKCNLRITTPQQSSCNIRTRNRTLPYRGISYSYAYNKNGQKHIRKNPYLVQLGVHPKQKFVGYFDNPLHAAMAYDIWAKEWYGEYANLNFP